MKREIKIGRRKEVKGRRREKKTRTGRLKERNGLKEQAVHPMWRHF